MEGYATLAYNCGNYDEAKYLVYCGLSGSPYREIKLELEALLENIRLINEVQGNPEQTAETLYIEQLRKKAINLKIESKTPKHSKAIYTEHIVDFLKTVGTSYLSYARVSFRKYFNSSNSEDSEAMLDSFVKQSKPLCVNLGFSSFGVSIIADNETMFKSEFYSPAFTNWKDGVFEGYKSEVILPDYNSEQFLNQIVGKYSEEERNQIYTPIINSTKETSPYRISLTDSTFKRTIKTYTPPQPAAKTILIPPPKPTINLTLPETSVIVKSTDLISSSGKGKRKNLERETMEVAEFKWTIKDLESDGRILDLNTEYALKVVFDHGTFSIEDLEFNIYVSAKDMDVVKEKFSQKFIETFALLLIKEAAKSDTENTSTFSQEDELLLEKFNLLIYSRSW